ncbi:hypothetical protein BJX61DRAFT_541377 [Aspergillus egyptiacus]|nr:hypothetical protein BJX61DRAFT_541377 [Aspergillus egyptiacus]
MDPPKRPPLPRNSHTKRCSTCKILLRERKDEYDVFCAICSCSLGSFDIGSEDQVLLLRRHLRIERRVYWRGEGLPIYETDDEDSDVERERLATTESLHPPHDGCPAYVEDDVFWDSHHEELHSYDPDLFIDPDLDWLGDLLALGVQRGAAGEGPKYYYTEFIYSEKVDVLNTGTASDSYEDENAPEFESSLHCYHTSSESEDPVFPVHLCCLELLSRAITGTPDIERLHKSALYDVMYKLKSFSNLKLPYGDISGADYIWQCIPGEDYSVACPTSRTYIDSHIRRASPSSPSPEEEKKEIQSLDPASKVISDPFSTLPPEITGLILDHVPNESLSPCLAASWVLHARTQRTAFWKRRVNQHMPWFWELRREIENPEDEGVNLRKLCLSLEKDSRPEYGMRKKRMLSVANRRRIWDACQALAEEYHSQVQDAGLRECDLLSKGETMRKPKRVRDDESEDESESENESEDETASELPGSDQDDEN